MSNLRKKAKAAKVLKTLGENADSLLLSKVLDELESVKQRKSDPSPYFGTIESLRNDYSSLTDLHKDLISVLKKLQKEIKEESEGSENRSNIIAKELGTIIEQVDREITDLRDQFHRWAQRGGGSANRKISINGTVMSTRYTDVNYMGSGAPTAADNDTTRQVDLTFSGGSSSAWFSETPAGVFDDVNTTFTLTGTPVANSLLLYLNGQYQTEGSEYTLSGAIITFASPPSSAFSGLPFQAKFQ